MPAPVLKGGGIPPAPPIMGRAASNRMAPMPREQGMTPMRPGKGSPPGDTSKSMGQSGKAKMVNMLPPARGGSRNVDTTSRKATSMAELMNFLAMGNQEAATSGGKVPGANQV